MGKALAKAITKLFSSKKKVRILMLGLDNGGKTSVINKLKNSDEVETVPTVGFNVEKIRFKNLILSVWDVGGQDKIRPLWRHYFTGTDAIVWVVDSSDHERLDESRQELHLLMRENEVKACFLLIFANKSDKEYAMNLEEVKEVLCLDKLGKHKPCYIQQTCAISGEGILEGLTWLSVQMKKHHKSDDDKEEEEAEDT